MKIKQLFISDIKPNMLDDFNHYAEISHRWGDSKRKWIVNEYFPAHLNRGGVLICAFDGDRLTGFSLIDGVLRGSTNLYANLSMIFVDFEYKRKGVGSRLFAEAYAHAKTLGADKLFISAVMAQGTMFFYRKMGCVNAREIIEDFVDTPEDCMLEYSI